MALDETNRARTWAQWMRDNGEPCAFTKVDLRAALNATDAWLDTNATAFNQALPQPFRAAGTADQKTLLLCFVALRRQGLLETEED